VASRSPEEPLAWQNSTLLDGDAADAVADLRLRDTRTSTTGVVIATYEVASARPA
jgi:hypothetical protein